MAKPPKLVKIHPDYVYTMIHKQREHKQYNNCFIESRNNGMIKKSSRLAGKLDYLLLVYLVTALVPSDTACLASSPGRRSLTEVWISLEVMVDLLL